MDEQWMTDAECLDADPEIFFPEVGSNGLDAKKVCVRCPVIQECLEYAMYHNIDDGVWGGLSGVSRIKLRRRALKAMR
jgi:WhiB family redox-sensing transcriptional regulator